jgi:hypothetical protein
VAIRIYDARREISVYFSLTLTKESKILGALRISDDLFSRALS